MTDTESFLDALADDDCKSILRAICDDAKTVPELSDDCNIPLSTAYRKVKRLHEADLVEREHRLCTDAKPKTAYRESFDSAVVSMTADGEFQVELVDADERESMAEATGGRQFQLVGGD